MKRLKLIITICMLIITITSCKKTDPSCTPVCNNGGIANQTCGCDCPAGFTGSSCQDRIVTPPSVPLCERNHTAIIYFKNNSSKKYSYDVIWDGLKKVTLSYQTLSIPYTVTAGKHTLIFKIKNTNTVTCTQSTPILVQCTTNTYSCSY